MRVVNNKKKKKRKKINKSNLLVNYEVNLWNGV